MTTTSLAPSRRPLTLPEKILTHWAVGLTKPEVIPGQMLCVKAQWTLACEITWKSMDKTYQDMGRPRIWRNDRFWLAVDHTVDPRVNHQPRQQMMIKASEDFAKEAKLTNFQPPNTTILHTEFYRQRAQPGQIVVGADSHSCSTGGLGAFAIGLGAADVVMPLVTGETWIKVPETVLIEFVGTPPMGMGGKDVMLYTLGKLKCNTVAIGRCVEWGGNISALSCDARFAISNMTAEFGGIAGVFPADEQTAAYISKRPDHNQDALYFRADENAEYSERFQIDLDNLEPQVALFPSPDNVKPVSEVVGMKLDGCFIGACTTAEEDLVLGALVLEACLKQGMKPVPHGQRRVTPGSQIIIDNLKKHGLLQVYENAGFVVGAPGCSFCLGIAADVAGENEVWLSSQNRNYRNRMGKGSIANLASAITVAASSFTMEVTDPRPFLSLIDIEKFHAAVPKLPSVPITIAEVAPELPIHTLEDAENADAEAAASLETFSGSIAGRVQVFGDNIDTDAILPGEFLCENDMEALGKVAFLHTNPDFRDKVKQGQNVVVAGHGFGCGSSREQAVTAMKGAGVKALIARSFGYIFSRNYQNFSLLGIQLDDDRFYELATDNAEITVNMTGRTIEVGGETFRFNMSLFEERLLAGGGIMPLYKKFGNRLFRVAVQDPMAEKESCGSGGCSSKEEKSEAGAKKDISW
ncbi:3-isopropylmalate dehydrogenase [Plasmopara halstedii]|uniref:3-isopropylmalate dehydrogenase n=1 Tax=Plasmopara halstedii TaxID=4781 RepID=A0A0N7L7J8_PLAHL|nr:3-isopropylmalate dehydrogenase [Plasmopara halstedii]CEG47275.1 3-isopropylmalate dehydrogenase [Plasmopara halstedii]|eukprot:XP_024583644.1 3-isopropylmalate dehydrogenase [Plasmopara halstedii]